jgi:hypothetical protein
MAPEGVKHLEDHKGVNAQGQPIGWTDAVAVAGEIGRPDTPYEAATSLIGNGSARLGQVGGEHYKKHKIQPWDVWDEYDLDRYTANAVKYLLRGGDKPGNTRLQDLRKARHYLDKAIEMEEGSGGQT